MPLNWGGYFFRKVFILSFALLAFWHAQSKASDIPPLDRETKRAVLNKIRPVLDTLKTWQEVDATEKSKRLYQIRLQALEKICQKNSFIWGMYYVFKHNSLRTSTKPSTIETEIGNLTYFREIIESIHIKTSRW